MITSYVDIFLGLDVGKTDHRTYVATKDGTKIWNSTLPNVEAKFVSADANLSAQLKHAGKTRIDAKLKKHGTHRHTAWAGTIIHEVYEQTVTVV